MLIKIATGDGWSDVLNAVSRGYSITNQCIVNPTYNDFKNNGYVSIGCGDFQTTLLYFYTYLLIVKLIFLNLFIAIILSAFEEVTV